MNQDQLDQSIQLLQSNKQKWLGLSLAAKIDLLDQLIDGTYRVAHRQVRGALTAKGLSTDSPLAAEEWLGGPVIVLRNLRLLRQSLKEIDHKGVPFLSRNRVRQRRGGQVVAEVFPNTMLDRILYRGFRAEVWMQPEVTQGGLHKTMGVLYQETPPPPKVALVLGAGNVASIGPLDVIYKLFVEGQVCLLKLNPVNDYLGTYISEAFHPLIEQGFLDLAYGGADVGAYLCAHEGIDEIHITGSDRTHDAIVYGRGEEGQRRKANNQPLLTKRITSELGNVSPVIVVPGEWRTGDLQFHAENIATQMTNNAGFNCNAAKVLIMHKEWHQRESFLEALRHVLRQHPSRPAYYPGAEERYARFTKGRNNVERLGPSLSKGPHVPWTLITDLDPTNPDEICFTQESFCGVTGEVGLSASHPGDFLEKAVDFCNDVLWGTLNACILIHPETSHRMGSQLEESIAKLRYGSIAVNHWPALSYALGCTTWGAYPGHTLDDIQSGIGVVHNTYLFDKPQKSVIYGPFNVQPRPPWFVTHPNAHKVAPLLASLERDPSFFADPLHQGLQGKITSALRLPSLLRHAMA